MREALDRHLADANLPATITGIASTFPAGLVEDLDKIVASKQGLSYRDGLIIQSAYGLEDAGCATSHGTRPPGSRNVAADIGEMLQGWHIPAVRDAYQNIAKNSVNLVRGNHAEFDKVLPWLDTAPARLREQIFEYAVAKTASTARNVLPMPALDRSKLTFHACSVLLHELFKLPSGGAYQQFAVASFLHAVLDEQGQLGVGRLRVDTKPINASDKSSKVAGDVQVLYGNRLEEAFEVTANDWRTKIGQATDALKQADLQRVHIIAPVEPGFRTEPRS